MQNMAAPVQYSQFGKYLLLDRIAVGGMAEVYRAKFFGAERFEKILAIKKLLPNIAEDEEFVEMFINEAKLASQLTHSNICQIYDLGKIEGNLFIAMEYVWGKDLLQIVNYFRRRKEFMPPPMAAYIATRICEGIDYAYHKRGAQGMPLKIIHRDVSPQNILISYDGEVKIIDFGIAKATLHHSETQAGLLKGKFSYMSPEQVQGFPIDHRSDIFAIGTCLFEMLTRMSLFRGDNDFITLERVRKAEVPKPTDVNPKIPKSLEKIVMKALALDPKDRWQRAADFQDALQRFLITTPPIYTAKRLSDWMRVTFSQDIENEKTKMEEYSRIGPEVLRRSLPPSQPPKAPASVRKPAQPKRTLLGFGPPPLPAEKAPPGPGSAAPITLPRSSGEIGAATVPDQKMPPLRPSRKPPPPPPPAGARPPAMSAPTPPPGTVPAPGMHQAASSIPGTVPAPHVAMGMPPGSAPPPMQSSVPVVGQGTPPGAATRPTQPGMVPMQAAPADDVIHLHEEVPREPTPRIDMSKAVAAAGAPVPASAAPGSKDEKQKIVAIPRTGGKGGVTTTTLKTDGQVDFEEDEEPTRALDDDAAAIENLLNVDITGLKDSSEPVYSEPSVKRKGAVTGDGAQLAGYPPSAAPTPPGAVPAPLPSEMAPYPHGTIAIGPDGQPVFIPFMPQKPSVLSPAMKWVLVMAISMVLMVIGGVVVYILVIQTKLVGGKAAPEGSVSLAENQGAVLLRIFPSTAKVKVNGKEIPSEKLLEPVIVPAQVPVEVEVWEEGYKRQKFPLLVPPKKTITKEVALDELQGRVIVNSVPDKAEVYVGGQLKGETPATLADFPIGDRITITVKKKDYELWSEMVELNEEKTERTLVAILQKVGKKGKDILAPVVTEKETPEEETGGGSTTKTKKGVKKTVKKTSGETEAGTAEPVTTPKGKGGEGYFIALTKPWAKVLINGKDSGRKTPIVPTNPIKLSPGSYKVTFVLPTGESYNFNIKIKGGEQTKLIKNFEQ
jgi:serine/threonine protein kinase